MRTTMRHVDGTEVIAVVSLRDLIFVKSNPTNASVLILKQMSVKLKMEIHVKFLSSTKVHLTIGVPELTAVQIGATTMLQARNGAIVT